MKDFSSYVVNVLIALHPKSFKEELGEDMKQVMLEKLQESKHKTRDIFSLIKEGCVAIPSLHIHCMKDMQEYYEIENGVLVKKYRRNKKKKGPSFAFYAMFMALGGMICVSMLGKAYGVGGDMAILISLFAFLIACLFYRNKMKLRDSVLFGFLGFTVTHILGFLFFTFSISREFGNTFLDYSKIKKELNLPQYDQKGSFIPSRFWKEEANGSLTLVDKHIWCEKFDTGLSIYEQSTLEESGMYRKGIEALLLQSFLASSWAQGCMSDKEYLKRHSEMAKKVWRAGSWFNRNALDYVPYYQLLEVSDYIIAPRLFLTPMKICPVLFDRAYPELKSNSADNNVGNLYCVEKYGSTSYNDLGVTSYTAKIWIYAFGWGRKNMNIMKANILNYDGMSIKEFNKVYIDIKNDHKKVAEMVEKAKRDAKTKG